MRIAAALPPFFLRFGDQLRQREVQRIGQAFGDVDPGAAAAALQQAHVRPVDRRALGEDLLGEIPSQAVPAHDAVEGQGEPVA